MQRLHPEEPVQGLYIGLKQDVYRRRRLINID